MRALVPHPACFRASLRASSECVSPAAGRLAGSDTLENLDRRARLPEPTGGSRGSVVGCDGRLEPSELAAAAGADRVLGARLISATALRALLTLRPVVPSLQSAFRGSTTGSRQGAGTDVSRRAVTRAIRWSGRWGFCRDGTLDFGLTPRSDGARCPRHRRDRRRCRASGRSMISLICPAGPRRRR